MTADLSRLEALMLEMQALGIAELRFEDNDTRIHLTNDRHTPSVVVPEVNAPSSTQETGPTTIVATMYGQFYGAPSPAEPPFVRPGDTVEPGETLYILEVMKTLSRIDAEFRYRILAVLQTDGQAVEPGTPLFTIEPLDA